MTAINSETVKSLLAAGFTRPTLCAVTDLSLPDISAVKTGRKDIEECIQKKLDGLLKWAQDMKDSRKFNVRPAPYYELQIIVLSIEDGKKYTSLHRLYESGIITADEMKEISLKHRDLYDYSAFVNEFPEQADILGDEEAELVIHHGVPEVQYDSTNDITKARKALERMLPRPLPIIERYAA